MPDLKVMLAATGMNEAAITDWVTKHGNDPSMTSMIEGAYNLAQRGQAQVAEAQRIKQGVDEFWAGEATAEMNTAFSNEANAKAEAAFYREQVNAAKQGGFIPKDAPGFVAPTNNGGGGNGGGNNGGGQPTNRTNDPNAPKYITIEAGVAAIAGASKLMARHQQLFGEPLMDLDDIMSEAGKTGKKADDVWRGKYNVAAKEKEIADRKQKEHDDAIRKEEREKTTQEMTQRYGSNPDTRQPTISRFSQYARGEGQNGQPGPDRLAWSRPGAKEKMRQKAHELVAKEQQGGSQRVQ